MKESMRFILLILWIANTISCVAADPITKNSDMHANKSRLTLNIRVGNKVFVAKLYDTQTVRAFMAQLPLNVSMDDLNKNEKYWFIPERLPVNELKEETIHAGDIRLYGNNCLVLFYQSFSTSYTYTRLGYIEDVTGLATALGSGSVQVVWEW